MKVLKSLLSVSLVLLFAVALSLEARAELAAPKITKVVGGENFVVSGMALAWSQVLIYLDGNFIGQTETKVALKQAESGFSFQSKGKKLADGTHAVMAVAKDKTSLVLSAPSDEVKFSINLLPAPTVVAPNDKTIAANINPLVAGLTVSGSSVKIYIDGIYGGKTEILTDKSNTANFALRSPFPLSRGWHKVYAIAEDRTGKVSSASAVSFFSIELPMPAPTMLKPVVNKNTSVRQPFIVGLAKNNSKIKVYIDKKFNGELGVKNHLSGTANFAYKPVKPLSGGNHSVYTVAVDSRGKQSRQSNIVNFSVRSSAIAKSAKEKSNTAARIEEPKKTVKASAPVISKSSGAIEKKSDSKLGQTDEADKLEKVKSLAAENSDEKAVASGTGLINEGQVSQSKLKLSLVLFILFLVGVVGWLLWVNRELVKERRTQNKAEDEAEKDKTDSMSGGQDNKLL